MILRRTLSAITLFTSLTLSTSTYTLASSASALETTSSHEEADRARHSAPDYAALETAFPDIFRGFTVTLTDLDLIEKYR